MDSDSDSGPTKNREYGFESESAQYEHVLYSTMLPLGFKSEYQSVSESVSGNVNEPLVKTEWKVHICAFPASWYIPSARASAIQRPIRK